MCKNFYILLGSVCQHFVEDFCAHVYKHTDFSFVFLWFLWFQNHSNTGFEKCSSSIFWKSLQRSVINSLNVWKNSQLKPSGPGIFFVPRFFDYWLNLLPAIHLLSLSISSLVVLVVCVFCKFLFHVSYLIYQHTVVHNIFNHFYFCKFNSDVSFFISFSSNFSFFFCKSEVTLIISFQ